MAMQGMERDPLHKLETVVIPIGQDRSPFVIPMNPSRMWIDLPGNGAWGDGKRGRYKDKKGRCDWCAVQRFILAGVILTFILWTLRHRNPRKDPAPCCEYQSPRAFQMTSHFLSTLVRFVFWQLLTTAAVPILAFQLPLFTNSSHITDTTGARVKLTCVSWAGHLETNIPEGLHRNSLSSIALLIKSSGFNCVRLTSSTWLWTRDDDSSSSLPTVFHHFQSLNLTSAIAGIQLYNPHLLHQTLRFVHESVVTTLASHDVMVILDNHVSKPQWCCEDTDGNGFWGDEYFNPEEWLQGLMKVAMRFRGVLHVVGMSLRNELRGQKQNCGDWERFVTQATSGVHALNPHVLIIAGGFNYSADFSFLGRSDGGDELVALAPGKLVYEFHWYKWFAIGSDFDDAKDEEACARVVEGEVRGRSHSHQKGKVPHFLSEFGVTQEGDLSYGDERFLECVIEYLKEEQESWALWALQGSYYLRHGEQDIEETFGVLNVDWHSIRNPEFLARLCPIQGNRHSAVII